jgi:hypothetical protein
MCFSAEADVVAGVVVGGIGIDALRQVRQPQQLALASLPVLLAAHELDEAFVWWGLHGQVAPSTARAALSLYLLIAFVVLPVLVPAAVMLNEPDARRRRSMAACTAAGAVVAYTLLSVILRAPISAVIDGHHIAYRTGIANNRAIMPLYVLATCGPFLASSYRRLVQFGIANLAAVAFLTWLAKTGLTSLWCTWAAIASVVIAAHLRAANKPRVPAPSRSESMV